MLDALLLQPTGRWNKLEDARADVLIPKVKKTKTLYVSFCIAVEMRAAGDGEEDAERRMITAWGFFCVCQPAEEAQIRHFG